jgi:hypothetical protein
MDKAVVRAIVDAAGDNNICITMDNMLIYNTKMQGSVVSFDDANEVIMVLRVNEQPSTMFKGPFELHVNSYEDIQAMSICAANVDMNKAVDALSSYIPDKVEDMKKFLNTSTANQTYMPTPSTQNITDRVGSKPQMYRTDEYGTMENRAKPDKKHNPLEPIKTIKLNEDGSIPVDIDGSESSYKN